MALAHAHAVTGKRYTSRYSLTQADALEKDPLAVRLDWSSEVRQIPETADEKVAAIFSRSR